MRVLKETRNTVTLELKEAFGYDYFLYDTAL